MGLFDHLRPKKKLLPSASSFRCPRCHRDTPDQTAALCFGFRFCPDCGKLPHQELLNALPQCPACARHFLHRDMHALTGANYCHYCAARISLRFTIHENTLIEVSSGARLEHLVIFDWMTRPSFVRGSVPADAEQFIILLLSDRVEIIWHYTDYEQPDPQQQSVTGIEVLPADYFRTHTMEDFIRFIQEQPWGHVFYYQIRQHPRLSTLFSPH